mmetsp:Transcript_18663/g.30993  ORF Transcript_18663/g.30993 Transcript_18663/m.30993 type:complete len:224 (+) Transcript_18663:173-844(+)
MQMLSPLEIPLRCLVLVRPPARYVLCRVRVRPSIGHLRPEPLGKLQQRSRTGKGQANAVEYADGRPRSVGVALEPICHIPNGQIFHFPILVEGNAERFGTAFQFTPVRGEGNSIAQTQRFAIERSRVAHHEPNTVGILRIDRPPKRIGVDVRDCPVDAKGRHGGEVVLTIERADVGTPKDEFVREGGFVKGTVETRFGVGKFVGQLDERIVGIGHLDRRHRCC